HDSNDKERRQDAPRLVDTEWTEFRERPRPSDTEWSPADKGQPRRHRLPHVANLQEPDPPPWRRQRVAEDEFPEAGEQSPGDGELPQRRLSSSAENDAYRSRHSLDPVVVGEPPPAERAGRGLASFVGLAAAALIGAAAALFISGNFSSPSNKPRASATDGTAFASRFAGDMAKAPEQPSSSSPVAAIAAPNPASSPVVANSTPSPRGGEDLPRVAVREADKAGPTVRGVTDNEIRLGISAPFTGSAKELGNQMKLGIEAAFNLSNDTGGVHGRQLKLVSADDGYEPARATETMKQLNEKHQVFGF